MSLADWLPEEAIRTQAHAADWREAITLAGECLVATGATIPAYTGEMIETVERLGPYIVIAPGIALAHSRPSPAVRRTGISWVTLADPVPFGHEENDPVRLVLGLAATDHDGHIGMMSQLATTISDEALLADLLAADSPADLRQRMHAHHAPETTTELLNSTEGEHV